MLKNLFLSGLLFALAAFDTFAAHILYNGDSLQVSREIFYESQNAAMRESLREKGYFLIWSSHARPGLKLNIASDMVKICEGFHCGQKNCTLGACSFGLIWEGTLNDIPRFKHDKNQGEAMFVKENTLANDDGCDSP